MQGYWRSWEGGEGVKKTALEKAQRMPAAHRGPEGGR